MGIKHAFASGKSDAADTTLVRPSNWNADHTIDAGVTSTFTLTPTSGLGVAWGMDTTYAPASGSTAIVPALMGKLTYTGPGSITGAGHTIGALGWNILNASGKTVALQVGVEGKLEVTAGTATVAVAGENQLTTNAGTITTLVLTDSQVVANAGTVTAGVGFRALVAANSGTIGTWYGFWYPDHSGISGITTRYAFLGQDYGAPAVNYGGFIGGQGAEIAPPAHPGIAIGRYYTAPNASIAPVALTANLIYAIPVFVPSKTTVTKLGFTVTTAVAGSARLGIYKSANGVPTALVLDAGTISTGTTGDKEITVSQVLYPGMYFLAIVADNGSTINWHVPQADMRNFWIGTLGSATSGASLDHMLYRSFTFGALPDPFGTLLYLAIQAEPHVWFRA